MQDFILVAGIFAAHLAPCGHQGFGTRVLELSPQAHIKILTHPVLSVRAHRPSRLWILPLRFLNARLWYTPAFGNISSNTNLPIYGTCSPRMSEPFAAVKNGICTRGTFSCIHPMLLSALS